VFLLCVKIICHWLAEHNKKSKIQPINVIRFTTLFLRTHLKMFFFQSDVQRQNFNHQKIKSKLLVKLFFLLNTFIHFYKYFYPRPMPVRSTQLWFDWHRIKVVFNRIWYKGLANLEKVSIKKNIYKLKWLYFQFSEADKNTIQDKQRQSRASYLPLKACWIHIRSAIKDKPALDQKNYFGSTTQPKTWENVTLG
jgi:hypothetical protein